jgi:hypothetical protein
VHASYSSSIVLQHSSITECKAGHVCAPSRQNPENGLRRHRCAPPSPALTSLTPAPLLRSPLSPPLRSLVHSMVGAFPLPIRPKKMHGHKSRSTTR